MTRNIQHFTRNGLGMDWDWARNITANSHSKTAFFHIPRNVLGGSARNQWLRVKPSSPGHFPSAVKILRLNEVRLGLIMFCSGFIFAG